MTATKSKIIALILLIIAFLILTFLVISKNNFIIALDQNTASLFAHIRLPALNTAMIFITHLGDVYADLILFIIFALFLLIKQKKYRVYAFTIATSLGIASSEMIKIFVARARPISSFISETSYSFPSVHATMSTILLFSAIFLIIPLIKNRMQKKIAFVPVVIIFPLIALSRIYLSVHFASDVIAGIVLGLICYLASFILIFHKHIDIAVK